jgi:hypothetical protein
MPKLHASDNYFEDDLRAYYKSDLEIYPVKAKI